MNERSDLVHELFEIFTLDESTFGFLDWPTGLIRLNCTVDQFDALWEDFSLYPDLAGTFFHEMLHFYQIASLGYLYRLASFLRGLIRESIPRDTRRLADFPTTVKNNGFLRALLTDFDRAGPAGLSVRSIVESLTYLIQKRAEFGYSIGRYRSAGERYLDHLRTASLPPEYTGAFAFADQTFGHRADAVMMMPVLAHVALCNHSPPEAFAGLCDAVARDEITMKTEVDTIIDYCRRIERRHLGFAAEVTDSLGYSLDPDRVYGSFMEHVGRSDELKSAFYRFLFKPEGELREHFAELGLRPILFNPASDPAAKRFREWQMRLMTREPLTAEERREKGLMIMYYAALSQRMIGHVSPPTGLAARSQRAAGPN
jgi:hypothetical protein